MSSAAPKSRKSRSSSVTRAGGFFGVARSAGFFAPVARSADPAPASSDEQPQVQAKLTVSRPNEPLEREADQNADRVMRMTDPEVQRAVATEEGADKPPAPQVQRMGTGSPTASTNAQAGITQAATGGQALPGDVRESMEPRMGADLGDVRVHTGEQAASLSNHLSARAFTYRNHIFFGRDQYAPGTDSGRHLLAHELTHTIQQGATVQRASAKEEPDKQGLAKEETPEVQRAEVSTGGGAPDVQRLGVQDALDYFADKAHNIPGFRMLTVVLGFNPINRRSVPRTGANLLRAVIELVPGGAIITRALDNHGVVNEAAGWIGQKIAQLGDIGSEILSALRRFIDSLSWRDIFDLGDVWDRAKRIFTGPIGRLISFGTGTVSELLAIVKRVILTPLARLAEGTRGYDLLRAVLGYDPVTGDPYPRTPDSIIGGFMKLIGQEEVYLNLKRAKALERAYAWFVGVLVGLMGFVRSIPRTILATLRSLTFTDVVTVVGAFRKIGTAFLGLAGRFMGWAGGQVISLLKILFAVVAPGVMPYLAKAKAAFTTILRNPIGFVRNLVRAGRLGFQRFAGKILTHLKTALINWLVGPLAEAGVYIPRSFSLIEIVKLVLSVLGLTWQNIRVKLVKIIPEPVLEGLEKTADVLVSLVRDGPAAAWTQIRAELTELKGQLISQVTQMVQMQIVQAAVQKLVSMINPAGAVIQAIVAIYNTISFFIAKARQIGAVVKGFINSISSIAAGRVTAAAGLVERTLVRTLTLVLGFMAKFAGLGSIPTKLVAIVRRIRQPIDKALDKIVAWLGKTLSGLVGKAKARAKRLLAWWLNKVPIVGAKLSHTLQFKGERKSAVLVVRSAPMTPTEFMSGAAKKANIADTESKAPIAQTGAHEKSVLKLQKDLAAYDENTAAAVSGKKADKADAKATKLDALMVTLGAHIATWLGKWALGDPPITGLKIARGSFSVTQKIAIAAESQRMTGGDDQLKKDSKRRLINVQRGLARRHVVSASDMGSHYEAVINGKKASEAKLLIEERGSIGQSRTAVKPPITVASVKAAAKKRYAKFFGYAKNLFIGDSRENSAIQEHLDPKHPEMQGGNKLAEHVSRMKRSWAIDGSFKETPVRRS